jgi:HEPN superfamily RiboL-PSP-like protein
MLLYIAGRFEFLIRSLVENAAAEWFSRAASFADLPKPLKDSLKSGTLEICRSPTRFGYSELEASALLFNLADSMRASQQSPDIKANVISMTDANMRPKVLADLLKRVEVVNFWREVGKQTTMKLHLNSMDESQCADLVQNELNAIMEARNQIAHPTSSTTFLDHTIVRGHVQLLKKLAQVTKEIIDVRLLNIQDS